MHLQTRSFFLPTNKCCLLFHKGEWNELNMNQLTTAKFVKRNRISNTDLLDIQYIAMYTVYRHSIL